MLYNIVTLSALIIALNGDCYLHYFRGSNNRLNEASANRNNANRLFDSQNNNRGGYNCCDLDNNNNIDETIFCRMYWMEFVLLCSLNPHP